MQRNISAPRYFPAVLLSVLAVGLFMFPGTARATDVTVDCTGATPGAFTSITAALNTLDLQGPHTIHMLPGRCVERVRVIDRERVTFDASPLGDAWVDSPDGSAPIIISGSHGITFIQMGATGGDFAGVRINRHSEASLLGMTIERNAGNGVVVSGGSTVLIVVLAQNNGGNGVNVIQDSVATFGGGHFSQDNGASGIRCSDGAVCLLNGSVTAQNNGFGGLVVSNGARARIQSDDGPSTFQGNNFAGIAIARNASAVISGAQRTFVQNNVGLGFDVEGNSSLALFDTTVSNNTQQGLSAVHISLTEFGGNNAFTGNGTANLSCDTTSLFSGDLTGVQNISCLRIERTKGPPRPGKIDQP